MNQSYKEEVDQVDNRLVDAKTAANWMGVSLVTFYKIRKEGMPYIKMGRNCVRYDLDELKVWLKKRSDRLVQEKRKVAAE